MNTPLVSIITPTFNPKPFAGDTVASVLAQTYADWEWVVVDDGSHTDVTPIFARDPRVRVFRQRNSGHAIARNVAMAHAHGEIFAFLDDDDLWKPEKLAKQLQALEANPHVPFCHTDFDMINEQGEVFRAGYGGRMTTYIELLTGCGICASTVMARRAACLRVGNFNSLLKASQDYDLWLKMARDSYHESPFGACPESLASYRVHAGGVSRRYAVLHRASRHILEQHLALAFVEGDEPAIRAASQGLAAIEVNYGGQAWERFLSARKEGRAAESRVHFRYALQHAPRLTLRQLRRKFFKA